MSFRDIEYGISLVLKFISKSFLLNEFKRFLNDNRGGLVLSFDEIPYGMNHIDRLMAYYRLGGRSNQHKEDVFFTVSDLKSTFSRNRAYKNIKDVGKFLNSLYEKDYLGKLEGKYNGKNIYYLTSKCEEIDYVLEVTDEHREKRDKIIDETFSV